MYIRTNLLILPMTKTHLWHVLLYNTKTFHLIYILSSLLTFSVFAPQARITILKLFVMEIEWKSFQGVFTLLQKDL